MTFWTLSVSGAVDVVEDHGEQLRATEGRFMMTSVADVESVAATGTTGKVVSACHWGNLLVWEEGHIQLEVSRKDGSTCHDGQINAIVAEEGELITIGNPDFIYDISITINILQVAMDGFVFGIWNPLVMLEPLDQNPIRPSSIWIQ